jgi:outer membrane lipoprotein SlyB
MHIRSIFCAGAAALALLAPLGAAAATVTVASGTQLRATMNAELTSKSALVGQVVKLQLVAPYPENDARFANATLSGKVVNVVRAGQGRKAQLEFAIDKIMLVGGQVGWFSAKVVSLDSRTKDSTGKIALSTLGGMVVGNILGKWAGTNAGGAVGAVAGALYASNSKEDITVPRGAEAILQLASPLSIRL